MGKKKVDLSKQTPKGQEESQENASQESASQVISHKLAKKVAKKTHVDKNQKKAQGPTRQKRKTQKQEGDNVGKQVTRNLSGAKLGRRSGGSNTHKAAQDPSKNIRQRLLRYLNKFGLKHGLVFRPKDRQKLNQQGLYKWNPQNKKSSDEQEKKIQEQPLIKSIASYIRDRKPQLTQKEMVNLFLLMRSFFDKECIQELYKIFAEVLESIVMEEPIEKQKERAVKLFSELKYFSVTFTQQKINYWIEIPSREKELFQQQTRMLFCDLVALVKEMLKKVREIRIFLKEEIEGEDKLMKRVTQKEAQEERNY